MAGIFHQLGRRVGPKLRQASWAWQSVFGNEADRLAAEEAIGRDLTAEVLNRLPAQDEATLPLPVTPILTRLQACLRRPRSFRVYAVHAEPPNAFALPGGTLVVTPSLLRLCGDRPDAIAFVLAHEMGHVIRQHALERLAVNSALSAVAHLGTVRRGVLGWIHRVGIGALQGAYSQDHEFEADRLGIGLVLAAGYEGPEVLALLAELERREPAALVPYFQTHPPMSERRRRLERQIRGGATAT